jgi:polysaccharide biosynthesis protein PslA
VPQRLKLNGRSEARAHARGMRRVRVSDQMKRVAEVLVTCLILVIALPLLTCVAVAIRWETPGPILEQRERIGRGGRSFQTLRFRTTANPKNAARPWAEKTTRVGRFLRHTRVDCLPQLINVLRGEMSLAAFFLFD